MYKINTRRSPGKQFTAQNISISKSKISSIQFRKYDNSCLAYVTVNQKSAIYG